MSLAADERWMRRAVELGRANVGLTADNPSVGCVLVKDGVAIAEAATAPGGRPHAEEQALAAAGETARGAVAYVTLEPCGQRSTDTASCAERLIAAGVVRVVVACADASTLASGLGVQRLRDAGVEIDLGLLATEAAALYAAYRPRGSP